MKFLRTIRRWARYRFMRTESVFFAFYLLLILTGTNTQATDPTASPILSLAPSITKPEMGEWYINSIGKVTSQALLDRSGTNFMFTMPFNTSNRNHGANVYDADCVTPFNNSNNYFEIYTTTPTSDEPDGFIQFDTTLIMNITSLQYTEYWTMYADPDTGALRGGSISVCIETYLTFTDIFDMDNGDTKEKIDCKLNILDVTVMYVTNFSIGNETDSDGNTTRGIQLADIYEEIRNGTTVNQDVVVDFSDQITSYECEENNLYQQATGKKYNQGDLVMICVTTDTDSFAEIEEFHNLKVAQLGLTDYHYVKNSVWNPEMTTIRCQAGPTPTEPRLCFAKIILLSRFFSSKSPSALSISGNVHIKFGGRRVRRNVRIDLPVPENSNDEGALDIFTRRTEEEEEQEGNGGFKLEISLKSASNVSAAPGQAEGLISLAIAAIVVALMA